MLKLNNVQLSEIYSQLYGEGKIPIGSRNYQRMISLKKGLYKTFDKVEAKMEKRVDAMIEKIKNKNREKINECI